MKMTKRVFKGIGGMILMLVAGIGTTDVHAQCEADILVLQNPLNCSSQVILEANVSAPVQSWNFILDGTLVGNGSAVILNLEPGTYSAGVVAITDQGCTAVDDTIFTVAGNPLEVNAGSDTVICQEQALLSVDINSTNPYEVNWYPSQFLSDPESETPLVTENVTNQWFIVDVHDLVTGCVNSDTILVTQQNPVFDTLSLCDGAVQIDLGEGANMYDWLSWTDTSGTSYQLNYPSTQHVITVDNPGQYFAVAYFQECGALTSLVTVEACQQQCFNAFAYTVNNGQCSDHYFFTSTGSGQIMTWMWDFGDGQVSTEMHPDHVFAPGTYEVVLTTINSDGCTAVYSETITVGGLSIEMSNDTIGCQQDAYMEVFPSGGSGNYSYEWFPQTGLSDPYSAVTHATGVHNQNYLVEVTDNATGCTVGGDVTVSSYVAYNETLYLCDDSVLVDLGPGGVFYNLSPLTFDPNAQSVWTDDTGTYVVYAQFPGCGALTSVFEIEECPSTCSSTITSTLNYGNCGAWVNLIASYSSPIDSAVWNLGNGDMVVDYGNGIPVQFYAGGNYIVQLTAYHTGGCISTTSYGITLLTDIEVDITVGNPIACNGGLPLSNDVSGGSGQYSYSWWPASAMDNPNAAIPWMTVTQNTFAIVEVVDQLTGCFAMDTIYVYANEQVNETIDLCADSVQLELDPGSLFYNWSYTDPQGGSTNLPNQTNEIWVDEIGTYNCFTYQSGCNQVIHTFEVIACGTNCSSEFITFENPQSCGLLVDFAGANFSSPVDSVVWNYGDGQTETDMGTGAAHFYGPGTYQATMIAYHSNGCVSDFGETIVVNSGLTVELIEDTVACNGTLFLSYNLTGGSGNYTYDWWPASLMSDPNASNPQMTVQYDTWVDFMITDTQSGCIAVDSMYVFANEAVYDSLQLCSDSLQLELNAGSMIYNWSFTDQFGNTSQLQNFGNEIWVDEPGTYICLTYYSGCNTITHTFIVEECVANDDVWPGDANSDNIVTNSDALYLGLAFNQTGPTRPAATLNWIGQPCPDWVFNFAQNNVNIKHADCDGNGIVNFDDTLAIDFNYLNTHNKFEGVSAGGNPPLWVEATPDTVGLEQAIDIVVHLGSADQPIDSLHGVAFSLTFNEAFLTENGFSLDFDNCALGTAGDDVLTFQKSFFNDGALELAITRNTLENFQGYGPIVHARIVTTDNLSGVHDLPIGVSNAFAITASETEVELTTIPDTVTIDPNKVGIVDPVELDVAIYPNPTNGLINVVGVSSGTVSVLNNLGQTVHSENLTSNHQSIDLSRLPNGVYVLHLRTEKATAVKRIRIIK